MTPIATLASAPKATALAAAIRAVREDLEAAGLDAGALTARGYPELAAERYAPLFPRWERQVGTFMGIPVRQRVPERANQLPYSSRDIEVRHGAPMPPRD